MKHEDYHNMLLFVSAYMRDKDESPQCSRDLLALDNYLTTIERQLEITTTDLHDTTAQLVMDEEVEKSLREKLEIAMQALGETRNLIVHFSSESNNIDWEYMMRVVSEALAKLEE